MADNSEVIIVTNDNVDKTEAALAAWAAEGPQRTLVNLDGIAVVMTDRIERIAMARNAYLMALRKMPCSPDLILVMDLDGPNDNLDLQDVLTAIQLAPSGWGGIFANQGDGYYDLYALRKSGWVDDDVWREVSQSNSWLRSPVGRTANLLSGFRLSQWQNDMAVERLIGRRQYKIAPETPFIKVDSAFGGLAIYKYEALQDSWYSSYDKYKRTICEHVVFNRKVLSNGYGLYICPRLINKSPREHLGCGSGSPIPTNLIV